MYRLFFVVFVAGVVPQIIFQGPCNVKLEQVVSNVDIYRMGGLWYQRARFPNPMEHGECSTNLYTVITPTLGLVFHSEQVNKEPRAWLGIITRDSQHPEKFVASYDGVDLDFYVLATNYVDYAFLYSCVNGPNNTTRNAFAWALVRNVNYSPTDQALQDITQAVLRNPDIQTFNDWQFVSHDNCAELTP